MRNLKIILVGIIFGLGMLSSSELAAAKLMGLSPQALGTTNQALNLIVQVRGVEGYGAGIIFSIDNNSLFIATAYHVVRNGVSWVNFRFLPITSHIEATVEIHENSLDLAILKVDLQQNNQLRNMLKTSVRIDEVCYNSKFKNGDGVNVVGHPGGNPWYVSTSQIYSIIGNRINLSDPCPSGHSGGAIFNERWDLIGMIRRTGSNTCRALSFQRIVITLEEEWNFQVDLRECLDGDDCVPIKIKKLAEQGVVRIVARNGNESISGSGVIVKSHSEDYDYIVTDSNIVKHFMDSDATLEVLKEGTYPAKIYRYKRPTEYDPPQYDTTVFQDLGLAVLVTTEKLPREGVKPLKLAQRKEVDNAVKKKEQVFVIGRPYEKLSSICRQVKYKHGADLYFTLNPDIHVRKSMLGGPVMNNNGHVLGITRKDRHGYICAVKADIILYLLEAWGIIPRPEPPLFYKKVGFNFSLGYSWLSMDPNLPRDLQIHINHPDDELLTGSPGNTDLDDIQLNSLELEIGPSFRLGKSNMALFAFYVAKIPFSKAGREERQQENDPRPPAEGSYIYTKLADASIGHIFRSGLGAAFCISESQNFWLEIRCLFDVGKWDMDFDNGWTRYGRDESEWSSEASGFFFSPIGKISLSTDRWSIFFSVGSAQISFNHPHPNLETHTGKGIEISLGGRFIL